MAEEVGNLKVKLGMDDAEFKKSLSSMERNLKTLGQQFRTLQNKGKDWGSTIDGLKSKQSKLSELLTGQKAKVQALSEQYAKVKGEQGEYSKEAENLALKLARAEAEMQKTETELSRITAELQKQESELKRSQTTWGKLGETLNNVGNKLKSAGETLKNAGKELSMKVSAPLTALGVGATKAAIDFESAFAGVRKTVDATEPEFKKLEKGILNMSRRLPASASDIAAVAESAGQLGIAKENILKFSETIINLGEATNLTAEQGATEFARFANIVGMSQNNFDRLGSSIVALGNTMATTESEIMSMSMRLAGQGSQVGMTESQIMALSATMSSLGINAEAGGTAMSTVLKKIQTAVGNGGKSLEGFSQVAGMTASEFKTAFETDAASALDAFIKGLDKSSKNGDNLSQVLKQLGISGQYEQDALLRLAGASELFGDAMETSSKAWDENTALSKEAEQRYKTTASQLKILKNRLVEVGISFGSVLLPFLTKIVNVLSPIVTKFAEMDKKMQTIILVVGGIVAAIGPLLLVFGSMASAIGSLMTFFAPLATAISSAGGVMAFLSGKLAALGSAFSVLTGPIGIAVVAIGGIVTAVVLAYNKVEWFRKGVQSIWQSIKSLTSTVWSGIKNTISSLISSAVNTGKQLLDKFKAFWNENGAQIMGYVKLYFGQVKSNIELVMGIIKGLFQTVWPIISGAVKIAFGIIQTTVKNVMDIILGVIRVALRLLQGDWKGAWNAIKQTATSIMNNIIGFFKTINLRQIGKDIVQGLINGIGSMKDAVVSKAKSIASAIPDGVKKVLKIASPSKVMIQQGKWTGQGLAKGLDSTKKTVKKSAKEIANEAMKNLEVKFDTGKISAKTYITELKKVQNQYKLTGDQARKVQKEMYSANQIMKNNSTKAAGEAIKNLETKFDTGKITAQQYVDALKKIQKNYKLTGDQSRKVAKEIASANKSLENSIKKISDGVKNANNTLLNSITKINNDLSKNINELKSNYNKQFNDLRDSIYKQVGLFDEVKTEKVESSTLLKNLQDQNKQFKTWQENLAKIQKNTNNKTFVDELRAMGVSAADEISAIANMTNTQLNAYIKAWNEKKKLANDEATIQLADEKKKMEQQINSLTVSAQKEIEKAKTTWKNTLTKLGTDLKKIGNFKDSGKVLGKDTAQGLINGLKSMKGQLQTTAQSLAKTIEKSIKSALKIKSPSRVMMSLGKFVGEGLAVGINKSMSEVKKAAESLADVTTKSMQVGVGNGVISTSYDYSKQFAPSVNIYTQDSGVREMQRTLRRMAYGIL